MDKNKRFEIDESYNMMDKFIILRKQFKKETSQEAIWNFTKCYCQEMEINIDYVEWLEKKIIRNNESYYEKNKK